MCALWDGAVQFNNTHTNNNDKQNIQKYFPIKIILLDSSYFVILNPWIVMFLFDDGKRKNFC